MKIVEEEVENIVEFEYGNKYIFESYFDNPNNVENVVRTIWVLEKNSTILKFVTAYPI